MPALDRRELLQWAFETTGVSPCSKCDDLRDGLVLLALGQCLHPDKAGGNALYSQRHGPRQPSTNWTLLRHYAERYHLPLRDRDFHAIRGGYARSCFNALVLFYFLIKLATEETEFCVDFARPVDRRIAEFLQSSRSLEAVGKRGKGTTFFSHEHSEDEEGFDDYVGYNGHKPRAVCHRASAASRTEQQSRAGSSFLQQQTAHNVLRGLNKSANRGPSFCNRSASELWEHREEGAPAMPKNLAGYRVTTLPGAINETPAVSTADEALLQEELAHVKAMSRLLLAQQHGLIECELARLQKRADMQLMQSRLEHAHALRKCELSMAARVEEARAAAGDCAHEAEVAALRTELTCAKGEASLLQDMLVDQQKSSDEFVDATESLFLSLQRLAARTCVANDDQSRRGDDTHSDDIDELSGAEVLEALQAYLRPLPRVSQEAVTGAFHAILEQIRALEAQCDRLHQATTAVEIKASGDVQTVADASPDDLDERMLDRLCDDAKFVCDEAAAAAAEGSDETYLSALNDGLREQCMDLLDVIVFLRTHLGKQKARSFADTLTSIQDGDKPDSFDFRDMMPGTNKRESSSRYQREWEKLRRQTQDLMASSPSVLSPPSKLAGARNELAETASLYNRIAVACSSAWPARMEGTEGEEEKSLEMAASVVGDLTELQTWMASRKNYTALEAALSEQADEIARLRRQLHTSRQVCDGAVAQMQVLMDNAAVIAATPSSSPYTSSLVRRPTLATAESSSVSADFPSPSSSSVLLSAEELERRKQAILGKYKATS